MFDGLIGVASGLRRASAQLRAISRELKRIGDVLELQNGPSRSTGMRMLYGDDRPGAVDEADVLIQSDAEFARLERAINERSRRGKALTMDEDPDTVPGGLL